MSDSDCDLERQLEAVSDSDLERQSRAVGGSQRQCATTSERYLRQPQLLHIGVLRIGVVVCTSVGL